MADLLTELRSREEAEEYNYESYDQYLEHRDKMLNNGYKMIWMQTFNGHPAVEAVYRKIEDNQTAKADKGKLQISLVPTQLIRDVAEIRMYGNAKYHSPDNWKQVEMVRYVDALCRHLLAFIDDYNSIDEESGKPHYKHMACNMAFICEMMGGKQWTKE